MTKLGFDRIKKRIVPGRIVGKKHTVVLFRKDFQDIEDELNKCWSIIEEDRGMAKEMKKMSIRLNRLSLDIYRVRGRRRGYKNES